MSTLEQTGYGEYVADALEIKIKEQSTDVKNQSKGTIFNRWMSGALITDAQLKHIKPVITDERSVKSIVVKQAIIDKVTGEFQGYKNVTKYYNRSVKRVDAAIEANLLTDDMTSDANELEAENMTDLELKNFDLNHARAELSGMRAVKHSREAARIAALREAKGRQKSTFDQIYAAAVKTQKLVSADMVEHTLEVAAVATTEKHTSAQEKLMTIVIPADKEILRNF